MQLFDELEEACIITENSLLLPELSEVEAGGWRDEDVVSPYPDRPLRQYQTETVREALNALFVEGKNMCRIVLPTGCGKTLTFSTLISMLEGRKNILVLVHRETIFEQIEKHLVMAGIVPIIERANSNGLLEFNGSGQVVLATPQTFYKERVMRWARCSFDLIVVDEAHHVNPPENNHYFKICRWFRCPETGRRAKVLGVTATPGYTRNEKGRLRYHYINGWDHTIEPMTLFEAIDEGYLCKVTFKRIPTPIDLSKIGRVYNKDGEEELNSVELDNEIYRNTNIIATAIKGIVDSNTRGIVFTSRIKSAEALADALNDLGVSSRAINSETVDRKELEDAHARGEYQLIISVAAHIEGWDAPYINTGINLRPTLSINAYRQMVGRTTRNAQGKNGAVFYDFTDATTSLPLVGADQFVAEELIRELGDENEDDVFDAIDRLKDKGVSVEELNESMDEVKKTLQEIIEEREKKERERLERERIERERLEALRVKNREEKVRLTVHTISPVVANLIGIKDFKPTKPVEPPTVAQLKTISNMAGSSIPTKGLTKEAATRIVGKLIGDAKKGLSSPRQRIVLTRSLGAHNLTEQQAQKMTRKEASEYIEKYKTW